MTSSDNDTFHQKWQNTGNGKNLLLEDNADTKYTTLGQVQTNYITFG